MYKRKYPSNVPWHRLMAAKSKVQYEQLEKDFGVPRHIARQMKRRKLKDWHAQRPPGKKFGSNVLVQDAPCAEDEFRTANRNKVIKISAMSDKTLVQYLILVMEDIEECLGRAAWIDYKPMVKGQEHRCRHDAKFWPLLYELARRDNGQVRRTSGFIKINYLPGYQAGQREEYQMDIKYEHNRVTREKKNRAIATGHVMKLGIIDGRVVNFEPSWERPLRK